MPETRTAASGGSHRARKRRGLLVRLLGFALTVGFLTLLAFGLARQAPDKGIDDQLARSRAAAAPGFALPVLAQGRAGAGADPRWRRAARDGVVDLSELRGLPVVMNIWASWCLPCREEAPVLRESARRWRERGVLFLGLNMQDVRSDARRFVRELSLDFPQVRDGTDAVARRWGATGIPETFFIDVRGRVVGHVIGTTTEAQLDTGVAAARSGTPRIIGSGGEQRPTR